MKTLRLAGIIAALTLVLTVRAAEIGHYNGGVMNIRDYVVTNTLGQVHAVGGQLGVTYVPWVLSINVHGFYEYLAVSRFQGGSFGVSVAKKFW